VILGVGIDVVQVARVQRLLRRYGDRFVRRWFTAAERAQCRTAVQFAGRLAAKEAVLKALPVPTALSLLPALEIRATRAGALSVGSTDERIVGVLAQASVLVSITDAAGVAIATAIVARLPESGPCAA
jgi:holo-[acyl-carrier protein] synthase